MSNSRLEKFIYAICGMEVDDLPTPLSRIETLWSCLITGETPDFEPLSRNEKYLMAMLTDNVDGLPEPTSRGEKLLYKIATGETDLSDVPGYLSRYEELLKQLIENGGIGGTDFEYVLYTLNQPLSTLYTTAEGPVKSAILKGQTLVNVHEITFKPTVNNAWQSLSNHTVKLKVAQSSYNHLFYDFSNLKPNGKYAVVINVLENNLTRVDGNGVVFNSFAIAYDVTNFKGISFNNGEIGKKVFTFTMPSDIEAYTHSKFMGTPYNTLADGGTISFNVAVFEVDNFVNVDNLEYFEGMQSVKMPVLTTTGKNLFNGDIIGNYFVNIDGGLVSNSECYATDYIEINPNTNFSINTPGNEITAFYDKDKNFITWSQYKTFLSPSNARFLRTTIKPLSLLDTFQLEMGTITTPYEPHKSNILTTTSKNLFNMNRPYDNLTDSQATVVQDTNQITVSSAESGIYVNANFILDKDFFAGKTVTGSCLYESDENDIGTVQIVYQDGNGEHHYQWIRTPKTFTFPNSFIGDVMLSISANNTDTPQSNTVTVKNIQLELGSTATPYEPYSEVTLRGIGEVKDTLDCLTGEVVQNIGEVSTSLMTPQSISKGTNTSAILVDYNSKFTGWENQKIICDKLKKIDRADINWDNTSSINGINISPTGFWIITPSTITTKEQANEYLINLNATIQYELTSPVVKTVALSTLDQDGQPTKLSTFNDITHVSIEAEDLLPTVDLEVPTKIEETLSSLPTQMNDISETQHSLNEKIDAQAENIKEVSTAMTEIRNDIL